MPCVRHAWGCSAIAAPPSWNFTTTTHVSHRSARHGLDAPAPCEIFSSRYNRRAPQTGRTLISTPALGARNAASVERRTG